MNRSIISVSKFLPPDTEVDKNRVLGCYFININQLNENRVNKKIETLIPLLIPIYGMYLKISAHSYYD